MKIEELVEEFRRRIVDVAVPQLWSDDEALIYAVSAHSEYIRRTGGVRDARGPLTDLAVVAGDTFLDLDPSILRIVSARIVDDRMLDLIGPRHDAALATPRPGRFFALVQGEDDTGVRCVNIPEANYTLKLVIERLPAPNLDFDSELEVRREHVMDLIPGMMALAYTKQDAETRDAEKASAYRATFLASIEAAYLEKRRRSGSARTVAYGGL